MKRHRWFGFTFGLLLTSSVVTKSHAVIIERIVAIVGERPILFSDLRRRSRPELLRLAASNPNKAQAAAAETDVYRAVLNRMVDEKLEDAAADKARISVTPEEVDAAIKDVAQRAGISVNELVTEAKKAGLPEQEYRDELRRQILEGKLIQLRVRGRVRVSEEDAKAAYDRFRRELGNDPVADLRILALRIGPTDSEDVVGKRAAHAHELAQRARAPGGDFCKIVQEFSEDAQTRTTCGSRGSKPLSSLVEPLQDAVKLLKKGETSDPIIMRGEGVILVVQLGSDLAVPSYEMMRDEMMNRASQTAVEQQKTLWLRELQQTIYTDIRL